MSLFIFLDLTVQDKAVVGTRTLVLKLNLYLNYQLQSNDHDL